CSACFRIRRGGGRSKPLVFAARNSCRSTRCSIGTRSSWKSCVKLMAEQSHQPSSFVFPVALQPAYEEPEVRRTQHPGWGWVELFVLAQVFWGVLLFLPGSQAYRFYIRAFPYVASLVAVVACARSNATNTKVPGSG